MTDRLEPCPTPWCEPEHEKYIWQGPDDLFCVICDGCQVEGPSCGNEGDAHDAWNTRTTSLAAQDGLVDALLDTGAHLAAAISLLEKGGKAAKKAAPSDKMFDQMIKDYKASLTRTRAALASIEVKP